MKNNPLVSIIIPTFNSERFLERCLKSVKGQTYPKIEIIVVDNYSKDRTREIAKKYTDHVFLKGPERSTQVNFGVKHAHGEYVYRVDSDFVIEPSVVEEAVRKCDEGYEAICVHNTSDPSVSFWAQVRKMERDCYALDNLNVAARFFSKETFERVGGFNEELVAAEDYDLHNRLLRYKVRIAHIKSKEIHIDEPRNLSEIAGSYFYYGRTVRRFLHINSKRGIKQISPIRPRILKNYGKFVRHPILAAGFIVYQIVRYLSAGLGFLFEI